VRPFATRANIAAPRLGMFCAALHKDLPQRKKDQIRAQRP
jgi:hypothetical protein